jgi:hypothetical protein
MEILPEIKAASKYCKKEVSIMKNEKGDKFA